MKFSDSRSFSEFCASTLLDVWEGEKLCDLWLNYQRFQWRMIVGVAHLPLSIAD